MATAARAQRVVVAVTAYVLNRPTRPSERRGDSGAGRCALPGAEYAREQQARSLLRQRLVEAAALGRLHAGGTSPRAGALFDEAVRIATQLLEAREGGAGDAHAARVAVVDEDRRTPGLGMEVCRQPTDVPAVAHRDQRQDGDLRVLDRVQRAEQGLERDLPPELAGARLEPQALGVEACGRQIERQERDRRVVGQALALVAQHRLGHAQLAE